MKHLLLITTGGTISCRDVGAGLAPALDPAALLDAVPDITARCAVDTLPLCQLDSTDMTPARWQELAVAIGDRYAFYDGFVITHGTDTLAYASATLACLIRHADKPVVLTGSQLPMGTPGSDAPINLSNAFTWALTPGARGVHIVFAGRVIRGLRARKRHTTELDAFESVNCMDSAHVCGDTVTFSPDYLRTAHGTNMACTFDAALAPQLALVHLTPGLDPALLQPMTGHVRALIVEGVGIGGIPESMIPALLALARAGIHLVLTSQVPYGACDFTVYRAGRRIREALQEAETGQGFTGVAVTCRDIPSEAAFAAAMWALAHEDDHHAFADLFTQVVADADL